MRKAAGDSGEAVQARARYRRDRTRADGKFINIISKLSSVSSGHCQRSRISRHGYGQRCRSTSLKRALPLLVYTVSGLAQAANARSEEHTSELQSLMRISYAVFCLK